VGPLGIDEQADAIFEAELGELRVAELALQGVREGRQPERAQFVEGSVSEHRISSLV
jgi:hypothetical protein